MSDHPMRGLGRAFCDALAQGKPEQLAPLLGDDVDWTVFGPVDLFAFFGHRRGKDAVVTMLRDVSHCFTLDACETERTLVDGDAAASMLRVSVRDLHRERMLSLRLAMFAEFRSDKLVTLRAVFDSFDAAEQAIGRYIDLSA